MAKISARGDYELARYETDSLVYVVTGRGRLLRKVKGRAGYNLIRRFDTPDAAKAYVGTRGGTLVPSRKGF